jgi:hypothetical protein
MRLYKFIRTTYSQQFVHFVYKLYCTNSYNKRSARAARAKPEHTSFSNQAAPGCPDVRVHPAAPTFRVHPAAPTFRVHPAAPTLGYTRLRPDQLGCVHGGVGLEMGLWLPSEKWDCTNSFVQHSQPLPSLKYPTCPRQALWRCCMPQRIGEGSDARLKPKSTT